MYFTLTLFEDSQYLNHEWSGRMDNKDSEESNKKWKKQKGMPTRVERLTSCCFLWVFITRLEKWVKWNDGREWQWREQDELGEREGLPTRAERLPVLVVTWEFSAQDLKPQVTYTLCFSHLSQTLTKCCRQILLFDGSHFVAYFFIKIALWIVFLCIKYIRVVYWVCLD